MALLHMADQGAGENEWQTQQRNRAMTKVSPTGLTLLFANQFFTI